MHPVSFSMLRFRIAAGIATVLVAANFNEKTSAQTVWSGYTFEFTKPAGLLTADEITPNVAFTRAGTGGLFNAGVDLGWNNAAPSGTEWATNLNNPSATIAATNHAALAFTTFLQAYGGSGSLGNLIEGRNAVVHLIQDDVYLDLRFTDWVNGQNEGGGGGFTYLRAEGDLMPPESTGDYNGNDVVDAADYVLWRKTLGQAVAMNGDGADGNRNGTVDLEDYNVWRMNFGRVFAGASSGTASMATVPEPATSGLLYTALLALGCRTRKRFKNTTA
jgi:hypothetical protein